MDQSKALVVAGIVFAFIAVLHVLRLAYKFDVIIAHHRIPVWANWVGLVLAAVLSAWMFMAAS